MQRATSILLFGTNTLTLVCGIFLSITAMFPSATSTLHLKLTDFAVRKRNVSVGDSNIPICNGKFAVIDRKFELSEAHNSCH
ncbi:MAG: hypothetical protein LBK94_11050 [Prevotellaceae bacterium]|nr:hypothetical protein [Prevotellaceae bacterium]